MADQPRTDLKQRLLIRIVSEGGAWAFVGNEYERERHQWITFDYLLARSDEEQITMSVVLDDNESVAGHRDEGLHLLVGRAVLHHNGPGESSSQGCVWREPWTYCQLLLRSKEGKLGARVDCGLGGIVCSQVLQVLLSCARCHAHELVAPVRCVLRIDHFRQQELCECAPLGEDCSSWNWRTKHWHVFASRHGNAEMIWIHYKDTTKFNNHLRKGLIVIKKKFLILKAGLSSNHEIKILHYTVGSVPVLLLYE